MAFGIFSLVLRAFLQGVFGRLVLGVVLGSSGLRRMGSAKVLPHEHEGNRACPFRMRLSNH